MTVAVFITAIVCAVIIIGEALGIFIIAVQVGKLLSKAAVRIVRR